MSSGLNSSQLPPTDRKSKISGLRLITILIIVVIIAVAAAFIVYPSFTHHSISSPPSQTPRFVFLPTSTLNLTYGTFFTAYNAYNYSSKENITSPLQISSNGLVNGEIMLYETTNATKGFAIVVTGIFQYNSSSVASKFTYDLIEDIKNSSTSMEEISTGIFDNFTYSMYNTSKNTDGINSTVQVSVARDKTFVLFMEFADSSVEGIVTKDMTIFKDQITLMLSQTNDKSQSTPTVPASSNGSIISFSQIVTIILTFVSGLFIGLALKKGILAFLFAIIGLLILGYVGIAFVPKVSITYEIHKWSSYVFSYISNIKFGYFELTLSVIFFIIGLSIGLWKG